MSKLPQLGPQTENAGMSWSDVIAFRSDSEVFLIFLKLGFSDVISHCMGQSKFQCEVIVVS